MAGAQTWQYMWATKSRRDAKWNNSSLGQNLNSYDFDKKIFSKHGAKLIANFSLKFKKSTVMGRNIYNLCVASQMPSWSDEHGFTGPLDPTTTLLRSPILSGPSKKHLSTLPRLGDLLSLNEHTWHLQYIEFGEFIAFIGQLWILIRFHWVRQSTNHQSCFRFWNNFISWSDVGSWHEGQKVLVCVEFWCFWRYVHSIRKGPWRTHRRHLSVSFVIF